MNEWERQYRMARRYKEQYPPGTRIELLRMGSDPHPIAPGTRGTVQCVDDIGTLHCDFDDGRHLGVIPGEDTFRTLTQSELEAVQRATGKYADFGDGCKILLPDKPVDCSRLGYFDELEYDCWHLVESYCKELGIKLLPQEEEEAVISFDIAKGIQDYIIGQLQEAGVQFRFETQETGEEPVQSM